uniref:tRNA-dihydrouridine(47) synthase [NAD(P)(+)] n=1 Tax=Photinus pyralis TaxID=7054 RepID=A0A1Y1MC14_PHOPY
MSLSGVCLIKPEYIIEEHQPKVAPDCAPAKDKEEIHSKNEGDTVEPDAKKPRLSKKEKRKLHGQNKSRPVFKQNKEKELCNSLINTAVGKELPTCNKQKCFFMHDIQEYLNSKPVDIGDQCYNFNTAGFCVRGLTCRFGKEHVTSDGFNIVNEEKQKDHLQIPERTVNQLSHDLQNLLKKRNYDFKFAEKIVRYNDLQKKNSTNSGSITDEDIIKTLSREKKSLDWKDKLLLSPLTTVGNLPFRRICKEYGADITCGEMAMCSSLLQGLPQEWALVKRHHTEKVFGVQLCANNPHLLTKCGQMLEKETEIDFIDLNLGCPIELVYREGGGCGLLRRPRVLEACVRSLSQVLSIPLTVKTRTGVYSTESIAHDLIPKFGEWGASMVTIHGRSREQRYTKLADWQYIGRCAQAAVPLPVVGNGDILSYEDYKTARESCPELTGVMIGRGALIKPWIFTEIKEQKLWDISSAERFDIIKKYVNYGLEHWGSDTKGVENTRRFLLEWLSFLYRYIPVALLERPPQKINERPPRFHGRDDLETLMASSAASDWIKISEMLLGKVPEGFQFLPKHKSNSYT